MKTNATETIKIVASLLTVEATSLGTTETYYYSSYYPVLRNRLCLKPDIHLFRVAPLFVRKKRPNHVRTSKDIVFTRIIFLRLIQRISQLHSYPRANVLYYIILFSDLRGRKVRLIFRGSPRRMDLLDRLYPSHRLYFVEYPLCCAATGRREQLCRLAFQIPIPFYAFCFKMI